MSILRVVVFPARWAPEGQDFSLSDVKADAVHRTETVVVFGQILDLYHSTSFMLLLFVAGAYALPNTTKNENGMMPPAGGFAVGICR